MNNPSEKKNKHTLWISLVMTNGLCDLENGPVEIVDLTMKSMMIFHSFLLTFTRG